MRSLFFAFGLLFCGHNLFAGQVDTLEIYSAAMQKSIRCVVIRPDTYNSTADPYPVVYLLHGWSGDYTGWLGDAPHLQQLVDRYNLLIVCPDGGYDSWYLDSPVDTTVRYETHITHEVVDYIDYYYNTIRSPQSRAIAGLSMGGHGAMFLASRHPELYGAAGSMAGGLDLRGFKKNNWDLQGVLGRPETQWENWERYSVVNAVSQFQKNQQALIIDCGVGDFFLEANREMHQRLLAAGVAHEYTERPGEHNGEYWSGAVEFQILFFARFFGRD